MDKIPVRKFLLAPLTIRLETMGGVATPLVPRGTPLPTARSERFSTAADNQVSVSVDLLLGESPIARNNVAIGKFTLAGIPPAKRGVPQIDVAFSVDTQFTICAEAKLDGSEISARETFTIPFELSPDKVQEIIAKDESNRASDEQQLLGIEATNRAKNIIGRAEEKLKAGPNSKLSDAIAALGLALASEDSEQIRSRSDVLESLVGPAAFNTFTGFDDIFKDIFNRPQPAKKGTVVKTKVVQASNQTLTPPSSLHQIGKLFGGASFTPDPQLCFVLMPFAEEYRPLYEDHIRPLVVGAGVRCERADEIRGMNLITWDIWERINRARFLIADLTNQNPNVFYELGLAHAMGKDVILITQDEKFVPFDLQGIRWIKYEFTPRGTKKLEQDLSATIRALLESK